jgi:hypothetical protein
MEKGRIAISNSAPSVFGCNFEQQVSSDRRDRRRGRCRRVHDRRRRRNRPFAPGSNRGRRPDDRLWVQKEPWFAGRSQNKLPLFPWWRASYNRRRRRRSCFRRRQTAAATSASLVGLLGLSARLAALRRRISPFLEERLVSSSKCKFPSAVATGKLQISSHWCFPFLSV